jgi:hypothetical protein
LQHWCNVPLRNGGKLWLFSHRFVIWRRTSQTKHMTDIRHFISALATVLLLAPVPATAADAPPVAKPIAALQSCRSIADAAQRLACYDKAVDVLAAATASGETVVVERDDVRKARKGLFGFTLPKIGFLTGREDNKDDQNDAARLETTVTAARAIGYGKWRFTVEGGAVWETVEASIAFDDPEPGAKVTIEKGSLGAYYAKVGKGRRVQAKRVG